VTYGLLAAAAWGISTIAAANAARRIGTYTAVLVSQVLGLAVLVLLAAVLHPSLAAVGGTTAVGLTGAGVLGLLGWLCYYRALECGPVGLVSAIGAMALTFTPYRPSSWAAITVMAAMPDLAAP